MNRIQSTLHIHGPGTNKYKGPGVQMYRLQFKQVIWEHRRVFSHSIINSLACCLTSMMCAICKAKVVKGCWTKLGMLWYSSENLKHSHKIILGINIVLCIDTDSPNKYTSGVGQLV